MPSSYLGVANGLGSRVISLLLVGWFRIKDYMKYYTVFAAMVWAGYVHAVGPSTVVHVSGDRQIVAQGAAISQPMVARAVDAEGKPVRGTGMIMGPLTNGDPGPTLQDEFGFRGFNVTQDWVDYLAFNFPPPQYMLADADGLVKSIFDSPNASPATYVLGVAVLEGTRNSKTVPQIFFTIVRTVGTPSGRPVVAVEYFNLAVRHYFLTANEAEVNALESGLFTNWRRSVGGFAVYPTTLEAPAGVVPVCRFFSSQYTSHFYTADEAECEAVKAKWPETWTFETRNAFYVIPVDRITGDCPPEFQPVYRLYSNRNGPSHRYVTDAKLRDTMVSQGWVAEGFGNSATVFCSNR